MINDILKEITATTSIIHILSIYNNSTLNLVIINNLNILIVHNEYCKIGTYNK